MVETCAVCGDATDGSDRLVLVQGAIHQAHCSEACLRQSVRIQRMARAVVRRRWLLRALSLTVVFAVGNTAWHRYRAPQAEWISLSWSGVLSQKKPTLSEPIYFGPAWPPTDDEWTMTFSKASWVFPLPGPLRRGATVDGRIFGPDPPKDRPSRCRVEGRCGVDLGGELWGEHVYAVQDGVVDHVHGSGGDENGGQYVRLSHFGGMVFTQYFHLAAIPRTISRGARVTAADVVGLLGDTGVPGGRRHLHFALSVRPSPAFPEVYWDPKPWLTDWTLRVPPNGTVAGFTSVEKRRETPRRRRGK